MTYDSMPTPVEGHSIHANWGWFLALGSVFLLAGVFCIAAPLASTLALTAFVAAAFLISGAMQIVQAFRMRSWVGFAFALLVGILVFVSGIAIWMQPLIGALALTFVVSAAFFVKGIVQIMLGFRLRPHTGWGWIVASGVVALVMAVLIVMQWPFSLGILAGVSLMFTGWGYLALAMAARRMAA